MDLHGIIGYQPHTTVEVISSINKDLELDDVNAAAAKLRRGLEEFSRYVCHNLKALVPYDLNNSGTLGDFLPDAISQYKRLLSKAKAAASSWDQRDRVVELSELSSISNQVIERTKCEQWAINPAVHFNNWENFSVSDFKPVVEAFDDLCNSIFRCGNCGSVLTVVFQGPNQDSVKCNCNTINWNLKRKKG